MASKYLANLSQEEYGLLKKKLYDIQNGVCYICQKSIDLDLNETDVDHIIPLANGGKDSEDNFALAHSVCNRSKQDADLKVARSLSVLDTIREQIADGKLGDDKACFTVLRRFTVCLSL